ncbi:hypothetical protein HL670_01662 [Serratia plymuthica]|uniref:AAA family ATPase n=1 Tax=Serratia plymuthica TaxID=82996 RepID=UPI00034679CA|nr:AAA family ATPase [Serratia plymuthica]QJW54781.1 hypothetical protein HL670_01662 [Serratia plymuthica]
MIRSLIIGSKEFKLISEEHTHTDGNIFTVIIGKNGTGKSRLLKSIVDFIMEYESNSAITTMEFVGQNIDNASNVIALSTNPFDKFPWYASYNESGSYHYLGLKDISRINTSKGYISKIIGSYLKGHLYNEESGLGETLNYLGFENYVRMSFNYIGGSVIRRMLNGEKNFNWRELNHYLEARIKKQEYQIDDYFTKREAMGEDRKDIVMRIYKALKLVPEIHGIRKLKIEIKNEELSISHKSIEFSEALTILISVGLLKFDSAVLKKIESNTMFSIEDASSGEQCVIISMLGISSVIEDNSLIMIDEPEVCLHPEWQEKYIQLLTSIFRSYKGCQFIIATHSPQIVSNLSEKGCYIMAMEDGVAKNAIDYINKSSDFQLATLFGTPGFKNEYLSRIAVNLFSNLSDSKTFTPDDIRIYDELVSILPKISEDDPLRSLIKAIEKMRELYA